MIKSICNIKTLIVSKIEEIEPKYQDENGSTMIIGNIDNKDIIFLNFLIKYNLIIYLFI